jgi:hypothetical protein
MGRRGHQASSRTARESSKENNAMNVKSSACLAALVLSGAMALATPTPASAQRWHHGGWGWGAPVAAGVAGLATGAVIGGALASGGYYAPGYYGYGYGPDYYGPGYAYDYPAYGASPAYGAYAYDWGSPAVGSTTTVVRRGGDSTASCMARFKSYDPASGTYMGYDGVRHPCP